MVMVLRVGRNNKILTVIFTLLAMLLLVGATQIANKTVYKNVERENSLESLRGYALDYAKEASLGAEDSWSENIKRNPATFIKINSSQYTVLKNK